MTQKNCYCDSGKPFAKCCEPLLNQSAKAKTAKQLMRSRYTAYALSGYGDYLLETWHPDSRVGLSAASLSEKSQNWQSLKVINYRQDGNWSLIEFVANYLDNNDKLLIHHELSRFVRVAGIWYYIDGKVRDY